MKIKQQPTDFQVEELTDLVPDDSGPFALYRLDKEGWTTPDAIQVIQRRWRIDRQRISYAGLKDRHASTSQYISIFRGPQRNLTHQRIRVTYLGQAPEPFTAQFLKGNRFRLTIRDLSPPQIETAVAALEEVGRDGVPNYFDDQRFGSVSTGGEFMARALLEGRHEDALRLALTSAYEFDRRAQKREKAILRAHWGDWAKCKELLDRSHARSLVDYLQGHPEDFRGAIERFRPELRGLFLSAYQSHLWNRMLAAWLQEFLGPEQIVMVSLRLGDAPFHRNLDEIQRSELGELRLPLPSARVHLEDGDPRKTLLDKVLADEGVRLEQFRLQGFRKMFFSRGDRSALSLPANVSHEVGQDELRPKKQKLELGFDLQPGSYATLIVKRIGQMP